MAFFFVFDGTVDTAVSFDDEDWLGAWANILASYQAINASNDLGPNFTASIVVLQTNGQGYDETAETYVDLRPWAALANEPAWTNEEVGSAGLTTIKADGWLATYNSPPTEFDPVGAPETFTVTRAGFDATGTGTTVNDTITLMKRVRLPFPNQTTKTVSDAALSNLIYAGNTIPGVVNGSALAAPLPVCMWLDHDLQRAVGQSYTARLAVAHMHARNGRPVAAVKFIATDGTTTVTQTVSAMSVQAYAASGLSAPHFAATLNLATLTANALVTIDAIVYPWIGAAYQLSLNGATYPSSNATTLRVLNDSAYGTAYAYVDPAGNDGTGVTSATPATAAALPYLTVAAAAAGIKAFNNTNYSRNNTAGGIIRLNAGTFTHSSFSASTSGAIPLVIEATNPANKATTFYQDSGSVIFASIPDNVKFKDITIKRQAVGNAVFFDCANLNTSRLFFENCTMDNSGLAPQAYQFYMYSVAFVTLLNCGGDDLGFAIANDGKKQLNVIGSTHSLGAFTYNVAACKSLNVALRSGLFGSGNRELSKGRFIGFSFLGVANDTGISHDDTIGPEGFVLVGCVLESRAGTSAVMQLSSSSAGAENLILQSNTTVGERVLIAYSEVSAALKSGAQRFCVYNTFNSKGDVFAANGSYVGNWSWLHKAGHRSNAFLRGDDFGDTFGVGQWLGEVAAFGDVTGTNAVPLVADWGSDRSTTGTGAGDGNYTPGASTALPFIPAGLACYAFDLYGRAVPNDGTGIGGAVQKVAAGINVAGVAIAGAIVAGAVATSASVAGAVVAGAVVAGTGVTTASAAGAVVAGAVGRGDVSTSTIVSAAGAAIAGAVVAGNSAAVAAASGTAVSGAVAVGAGAAIAAAAGAVVGGAVVAGQCAAIAAAAGSALGAAVAVGAVAAIAAAGGAAQGGSAVAGAVAAIVAVAVAGAAIGGAVARGDVTTGAVAGAAGAAVGVAAVAGAMASVAAAGGVAIAGAVARAGISSIASATGAATGQALAAGLTQAIASAAGVAVGSATVRGGSAAIAGLSGISIGAALVTGLPGLLVAARGAAVGTAVVAGAVSVAQEYTSGRLAFATSDGRRGTILNGSRRGQILNAARSGTLLEIIP